MKHIKLFEDFNTFLAEAVSPIPEEQLPNGLDVVGGLVDRGFDPKVAAAIAGNMWQESKFNPAIRPKTAPYVGLVQWGSAGGRKANLTAKPDWHTLDAQLDYVKHEFDNVSAYKNIIPKVKAAQTVQKAAELVARGYEGCSDPTNPNRLESANQLYNEWVKKQTAFVPPTDAQLDSETFEPPTQN